MESDCKEIINIGSDEDVSINGLADMIADIAGKKITIKNVPGPEGVQARTSDNELIEKMLGWKPTQPLKDGLKKTYKWIENEVNK